MTPHNNIFKGYNSLRFREAYNMLSKGDKVDLQDTLCELIGWSISTFLKRADGIHPVKESEIPYIEEAFAKYSINPWTGEKG